MTDTKREDFRFNYEKYENKSISIETIDSLVATLTGATSGLGMIIVGIKAVAIAMLVIARARRIDEQERIEKQRYEIQRSNTNRDTIKEDDLDELRRNT